MFRDNNITYKQVLIETDIDICLLRNKLRTKYIPEHIIN